MTKEIEEWLTAVEAVPYLPIEPGWTVLASVAAFERTSLRREVREEHLLAFDSQALSDDADDALSQLPQIAMFQGLVPLYDGTADGAIAAIRIDIASSLPNRAIMLCPRVAEKAGLRADPTQPLSFLDESGAPAVRSIWWRDGGIFRRDADTSIRGEGVVVIAANGLISRLAPFLGRAPYMHVWRSASDADEPSKIKTKQVCRAVAAH